MTDTQKILLDLLLEIDEICKEHGIEYYLDGGTALGAVRHRGFLPWDDDADIMFTRENWLKFEKAVRENPRPNRVIEGLRNCPDYTMVYARYCATDTTCILRTSMIDQFRSGLFVDLFVLDPVPDTPQSCAEHFEILRGYAEYLNPYYYDNIVTTNHWYEHFKQMGASQGRQAVIDYVDKKLFSNPDEDGMTYCFRYDSVSFVYPRDVVGKPVYVPFEDTFLPVAERVEDYLRIHYGDNWFMIPPVGQEELHNVVIDIHVPYEQFRDSYMHLIDRPQAIRDYEQLHELRIEQRRATDFIDKSNYTVSAKLFARMFRLRAQQEAQSLKEYIAAGEYDTVRQMLGNYYVMQLNRWFIFHKVFVPLEDEDLYAALYLLIVDGQFSKADKILTLRRGQDRPLSDDLLQIERIICVIRSVMRALEQGDSEKALRLSCEILTDHPDIAQLREYALRARATLAVERQDAKEAAAVIKEISQMEKVAFIADRLCKTEQTLLLHFGTKAHREAAVDTLCKLRKSTSDGMLRMEILDLLNIT